MHFHDKTFQKKNLDQITTYKVAKSWSKLGPNCQLFPKKEFLGNLNVASVYQLYPIMIRNILQISVEWILRYKVTYIWDNLIQITHLPYKEIFLRKMTVTFAYLLCPSYYLTFQKDNYSES